MPTEDAVLASTATGLDAAHDLEAAEAAAPIATTNKSQDAHSNDESTSNREKQADDLDWDNHPDNALNWPTWRKMHLIASISMMAVMASVGTSIISPATPYLIKEFGVGEVTALLPLSLYVFALAFGPLVGGPLSETFGRHPVYLGTTFCGAMFTLGCGLVHNFGALCFLRFVAGFCWGPCLAIGSGSLAETFQPKTRGLAMAIFILMPFLGPGLGPILGAFATHRQGWRWTQWILLIFAAVTMILLLTGKETFPPAIKRRLAKKRGQPLPKNTHGTAALAKEFLTIGLFRPIHMIFTEPLVFFLGIYVAINFGVLFSFFAAVPYTFFHVYNFGIEQSGLVFVAVIIGCILGLVTVFLCEGILYRRQIPNFPPHKVPPEYRLYGAMIASIGPPLGLFWYAWTAKSSISWASPAVAILPFAWGNLIIFITFTSYMTDTYKGHLVASQSSANSLMRYAFAGAFPLFITRCKCLISTSVSWFTNLNNSVRQSRH